MPRDEETPDSAPDSQDSISSSPIIEPLTIEEKEKLLARARTAGRELSPAERQSIYGVPSPSATPPQAVPEAPQMQAAMLDAERLTQLVHDFYPELGDGERPQTPRLIQGVIFDFDDTIAHLTRPIEELLAEGARAADAYMRAAGMDLPEDFDTNIIEARRFAEEKSAEENEEHLADDALSFLLQFFGYPASRMDPTVLRNAVDLFYAPEMTAWALAPDALAMLAALRSAGYRLALLTNYNCDRVFQRTVDYLGIRDYFDVCLSSASVEYRKPDTRFFNIVVERWGALPHEVVAVGDSIADDVRAGLELGAWTILVNTGATPQVTHDNARLVDEFLPDATVGNLLEIPDLVQAWSV